MGINKKQLLEWCRIRHGALAGHPSRKIPFRMCKNTEEMGQLMARELVDIICFNNRKGAKTHAIIPCGPLCWYKPFTKLVNAEKISLKNMVVFHMDECLDWEGNLLPEKHPQNFRTYMLNNFYLPVSAELCVPEKNRYFLLPDNYKKVSDKIMSSEIDITYGGWGQDGHVAFNQARREPYSPLTIEELRKSAVRIQSNSIDTVIALSQRSFGTAYQLVAPMSVTLGMRECLSAKKVRLFSDTGAWKQTALRIALFGPVCTEYPVTLLQEHPDALLTATVDTARHPIEEHPEWDFGY